MPPAFSFFRGKWCLNASPLVTKLLPRGLEFEARWLHAMKDDESFQTKFPRSEGKSLGQFFLLYRMHNLGRAETA